MDNQVTPISPVTAFLFGFFLVYGAMSFADDIVEALRSKRAVNAGRDIDDFLKEIKAKARAKAKAKKKTKKS